MSSNFGTPRKTQYTQKKKADPRNSFPISESGSNFSSFPEANQLIEDQYKLFIKCMNEVYTYERDPTISQRKFQLQLIKKAPSTQIDPNKLHFSEFEEEIVGFILVSSFEEMHHFFMDFYSYFDQDQSFKIEKEESDKILDFMASNSQMGKDKVEYLIEQLMKANQGMNITLKLLQKEEQNQLSEDLKDEFFKLFANKQTKRGDSQSLDMKKIFTVILAFFFLFTRGRIFNRREEWDKIRGIDNIKGIKTQITGMMTLSYALKKITGLDYMNEKDRKSKAVSYRNMEQVLLVYRNANKDIQYETITRVMADVEKYMKVDSQTKIEFKQRKMYKLIDYASLRIAFHKCCSNVQASQNEKFSFIEEIVLWGSVNAKYCIKKEKIEKTLKKFIQEYRNQQYAFEMQFVLNEFFKNKLSFIQKNSRQRIIESLLTQKISTSDLHIKIYNELLYEAQYKIKYYLLKIFNGFGINISEQIQDEFLKQRGSINWSNPEGNNPNSNINKDNNSNNNNLLQSKNQNATIKTSRFQQLQAQKNGEDDGSEAGSQSNQSIPKSSKLHTFDKKITILDQEKKSTVKKIEAEGDILNACFIMEGLLEKVQYMKKDQISKLKKTNIKSHEFLDENLDNSSEVKEKKEQPIINIQTPPKTSIIKSTLPKGSYVNSNRGSQSYIPLGYGKSYRGSEAPALFEDLKRVQQDDYQDDILDYSVEDQKEHENKQELLNNSVIALMMQNNQKYQRRSEYQKIQPPELYGSQDQFGEDSDDIHLRRLSSMKKSFNKQSQFGFDKSQQVNDLNQPKINKDVFDAVRRQQAIDRLSYYSSLRENKQAELDNEDKFRAEKNTAQNRTCSNCNIF